MADRESSFLSRWSRRKRDPDTEPEPSAEADKADEAQAAVPAPRGAAELDEEAGDPEVIAKLPDIESLDERSDFAPFMANGVPEILRRRALRKLWRLNPVFANLDGLNDYDEDFTDAAAVLSEIKTVYKVGKGMVREESVETTAEPATEETTEETTETEGDVVPEGTASPKDAPALAEAKVNPSADSIASDDEGEPVPVGESLLRPGEHGEAVDAVVRKTAAPPRRSAAARRWGEASE